MIQSRRAFCSLLPAVLGRASEKAPLLPSEVNRYIDLATEFTVLRLTHPDHTSTLPAYYGRAFSKRGGFMLYSSDRSGEFQPYRMELKSGQSRQLAVTRGLDSSSLTLMPDEKSFCYLAGGALIQVGLSNLREREVYRVPQGFESGPGLAVSDDGMYATLVERRSGGSRLRLVLIPSGSATTVVESSEEIADPVPRPRRAGILYRLGSRELHVVNFDGAHNQRLRVASGTPGPALWGQDGRALDYLNFPGEPGRLNGIREYVPDSNEDRLVAPTTQFVHFGRNADSSVYVGASGSKASPYLLLLVRAVKRELTLCEHKASDARLVAPVFSPNSQRVYFQTDRHGKLAIYSMAVDRLVAETE